MPEQLQAITFIDGNILAGTTHWIVTSLKKTDFPLLFDNNYGKKQAFYSVLLGLKGK